MIRALYKGDVQIATKMGKHNTPKAMSEFRDFCGYDVTSGHVMHPDNMVLLPNMSSTLLFRW